KEIWWGINTETPNQRFSFPASDGLSYAGIGEDVPIFKKVPKGTRFVTVRLVFKDDTQSDVVRFDNPAAQ
ncbi:MAG: hypothetical protein ACPGO3_16100, partial [Magnetospiraceae bacterium]